MMGRRLPGALRNATRTTTTTTTRRAAVAAVAAMLILVIVEAVVAHQTQWASTWFFRLETKAESSPSSSPVKQK
jgi:hypothetical protein